MDRMPRGQNSRNRASGTTAEPRMTLGRNDPCPCGSGRKYKHCCGAGRSASAAARPIARAPAAAAAANDLGLAHLRGGRFGEAVACFERAVALDPKLAVGYYNLGTALQQQEQDGPAIAALRRAVALAPRLADAQERLGNLLLAHGGHAEAVDCFRRAAAAAPNTALGRLNRAKTLHHEGKPTEAEAALRHAAALDPANAPIHFFLGHILGEAGRFEESVASLERAVALDPRLARAYHSLAQSKRIGDADRPLVERMSALLDDPALVGKDRVDLHFALGKAFDDLADYERAMHHYDAGNRLVRRGIRFDRAQFALGVNRLIASFTPEFFETHRGLGSEAETPLLILGMMRSGTTLVEQMLSNHSQVAAGGELGFWHERAAAYAGAGAEGLTRGYLTRLADDYSSVLRGIDPGALRVTDKMPGNFLWIGLIHLAFAEARIVHCRRHPVDTCLSIYFTNFQSGQNFAYDREDLAFYYEQYLRLMAHWRRVLPPDCFIEVDYEALVADPEAVSRELVAAIGLAWEDGCLRPESNPRVVGTASLWQVRQPVYSTSVERWRRYEPWLGELRRLLPANGGEPPVGNEPKPKEALRREADRLQRAGKFPEAIAALQHLADLGRADAALYNDLGLLLLYSRRVVEAAENFEKAVALDPNFAAAHYNFAAARERQRRHPEAIAAYRHAVELDPGLAAAHSRLGDLLHAMGETDAAAACYSRAAAAAPDATVGRLSRAKQLIVEDRPAEAEACLRDTLARDKESAEAHRLLGNLLREAGRLEEAAQFLERAVALDPEMISAYLDLVHSKRIDETDRPLLARMTALVGEPFLTDHERTLLHFALGKAFEDLALYEQAIGHFDEGNRIEHRTLAFDRGRFDSRVDRLIEHFGTDVFAAGLKPASESAVPVLVVGMPRSGTSLVEQILSSHPRVAAGGELTFWSERGDAAFDVSSVSASADEYLALLRRVSPEAARITDKNPFNFLYLGCVHRLFPNARIVHCRRSPIDTCLSIYFLRFATRQDFAYDRADLVAYYRQYARLMAHWRRVLPPERLFEVDYEELVADRETVTRRLVAFAGLDWDDSCLRPQDNRATVRSASSWQVRQPVYDTSVGRWRHYEPWLGELRALLPAPAGPR